MWIYRILILREVGGEFDFVKDEKLKFREKKFAYNEMLNTKLIVSEFFLATLAPMICENLKRRGLQQEYVLPRHFPTGIPLGMAGLNN
jgi:hypothetical protein